MRYQILFFAIFSFSITACGPANSDNSGKQTSAVNASQSNFNKSAITSPLETTKKEDTAKTNDGQTLAATVQGYFDSLSKNDEAGAKKYLSVAALKYFETEAKAEKKSWFAFVKELQEPLDEKRVVRNEKIEGDKGTAEIQGGSFARFTPVGFVKEDGVWKFDSEEANIKLSTIH